MTQTQNVTELRKAGKLEEALALAENNLNQDPNNIWNKRAISWVYYEYLKKYADDSTYDLFADYLNKLKKLELTEEEKYLWNNIVWPINAIFRSLAKNKNKDFNKINHIFNLIKQLPFNKTDENFSVLISAIHKAFKDFSNYTEALDWVGLDSLKEKDYQTEEYEGRLNMALAEQIYIAYAKNLEQGKSEGPFGQDRVIDKEKINEFLPKLERLIEDYPNYTYPPYFKAKLLLKLGGEDVLSAFLPFAKQKRRDYWVWQVMAEIYKDNADMVFSCYCKALSLKSPDEFLVRIRQDFTGMLIQRSLFNEAKTEINKILAVKERKGDRIPNQINNWMNEEWFGNAESYNNNFSLYKSHSFKADELLFQDIEEETIVVSFVNHDKKVLSFVKNENKHGFFKYEFLIQNPKVGDVLKVRFHENVKDNRYMAYTIKLGNEGECNALKIVKGSLRTIASGAGFLDNIYIEKKLIDNNNLTDNQNIVATAILYFNKKKNSWGWKAIEIL